MKNTEKHRHLRSEAAIISGRPVAAQIKKELTDRLEQLMSRGVRPTLAIVRITGDPAGRSYSRAARKAMEALGGVAYEVTFEPDVTLAEIKKAIWKLNLDSAVHGILVTQPLPSHIPLQAVAETIDPQKDVDGMHPLNLGKVMTGSPHVLLPSTALAVMKLIDYYGIDVDGLNVCVIGKSNAVGKPLTVLLLNRQATVSNCHTRTKDLADYTRVADLLVTATGAAHLVDASLIKEGATVIDVGFNFLDGEIVGDVDFDDVLKRAGRLTPVPGGVGSVTTMALLEQVIQAAELLTGGDHHDE